VLLGGLAGLDLPALLAAHRQADDPAALVAWDRALLARKPAREPREASRRTGRALLQAAGALTDDDSRIPAYTRAVQSDQAPGLHPIVHGLVMAVLGVDPNTAILAYAHSFLLGGLSAALRLLPLDYLEAQSALTRLHPTVLRAAERAHTVAALDDPEALSGFAPLAELLAMRHERGDARAFAT
jgi:urease accessory protein